jgi:hypothetical protein
MFGKHHTEDAKNKQKMALKSSGYLEYLSEKMKYDNPMKNPEIVGKVSNSLKLLGPYFSQLMKLRWEEGKMSPHKMSLETRAKLSDNMKNNNPMFDKSVSDKVHNTLKEKWKNPDYKRSHLVHNFYRKRPTNLEESLIDIINKEGFPFRYVGDRRFWIGPCKSGKCRNPDFIHTDYPNRKEVIEICGWKNEIIKKERDDDYNDKNIKALWLYKDDLNDIDALISRINTFIEVGK